MLRAQGARRNDRPSNAPTAPFSNTPDYVIVGHVALDIVKGQTRPGGSVLYAGAMAANLGRRVGLVTAAPADFPWPPNLTNIAACIPSTEATTFEMGTAGGPQRLVARAQGIRSVDIPEAWRGSRLVHLAPIAAELAQDLPELLDGRCVVVTAQGWLRRIATDGTVAAAPERLADIPFESIAAMVISIEDVAGRVDLVRRAATRVPVLALTRGRHGCTLFVRGDEIEVEAVPARPVDSVGAGDVFSAAFFVRLDETGDPVASARFASSAAALSVEGRGVEGSVPTRERIEDRSRDACRR